jgi:hypothetical protein
MPPGQEVDGSEQTEPESCCGTTKSEVDETPDFDAPIGECCDNVKVNEVPFLHKGPVVIGVIEDEDNNSPIGDMSEPAPFSAKSFTPDDTTGHGAFSVRMCRGCGALSNQEHRDKCEPDLSEIQVNIRRISNGYIVEHELGEIYMGGTRAVKMWLDEMLNSLV